MHTRPDLLDELESITDVLMGDHRELAELLVAEKQAKVHAYAQAGTDRVADRNHAGDFAALDLTTDIFRLKGKIAGHEARIRFIDTALGFT